MIFTKMRLINKFMFFDFYTAIFFVNSILVNAAQLVNDSNEESIKLITTSSTYIDHHDLHGKINDNSFNFNEFFTAAAGATSAIIVAIAGVCVAKKKIKDRATEKQRRKSSCPDYKDCLNKNDNVDNKNSIEEKSGRFDRYDKKGPDSDKLLYFPDNVLKHDKSSTKKTAINHDRFIVKTEGAHVNGVVGRAIQAFRDKTSRQFNHNNSNIEGHKVKIKYTPKKTKKHLEKTKDGDEAYFDAKQNIFLDPVSNFCDKPSFIPVRDDVCNKKLNDIELLNVKANSGLSYTESNLSEEFVDADCSFESISMY